jgi:hypothetical protein
VPLLRSVFTQVSSVTETAKFLFDECVSKPAMDKWNEYFRGTFYRVEGKHVYDFQFSGIHDEVWIPSIAADGYIIITADGGRNGRKKGEKLPRLCVQFGITHVVMTPSIHHKRVIEKTSILISVIADLVKLPLAPKGSRFSLRLSNSGAPVLQQIDLSRPKQQRKPPEAEAV